MKNTKTLRRAFLCGMSFCWCLSITGNGQTNTFDIPSSAPWSDTGFDVQAGTKLEITAPGTVRFDTTSSGGVDANGVGSGHDGTEKVAADPLPNAIHLSLIGKIGGTTNPGTGTPVPEGQPGKGVGFVGSSYTNVIPVSGRLFLGFNDDAYGDNSGSFSVTVTVVPAGPILPSANLIFWANIEHGSTTPKLIQSANLDGSNVQTVYTLGTNDAVNFGEDVLVDVSCKKLYFTDFTARKVFRSNFDGSQVTELWNLTNAPAIGLPYTLAINRVSNTLYWADSRRPGPDSIQQGSADGSGTVTTLFATGSDDIHGLAFNSREQKIYWCEGTDGNTRIRRANVDGSSMENVVTGLNFAVHIVIDEEAGKVYWTDVRLDKIQRADLGGTNNNIEDVVTGLVDPTGIAIDPDDRRIYWTGAAVEGSQVGGVFTTSLIGAPVIKALVTGLANPRGVDLLVVPGALKPNAIPGDVNGDLHVTGADSLLINQALVGLRSFVVTQIQPDSRASSVPTPVRIFGVRFPTNQVTGVTIGPPVNLTLSNVVILSREDISAIVPAGGGPGTGTVNVVATSTNGVVSFGRFINQ